MSFTKVTLFVCLFFMVSSCNNSQNTEKVSKTTQKNVEKNEDVTPTTNPNAQKTIVFFGNSLTAANQLDPAVGFAGLTQVRLDSLGYDYRVVNAGLSGETSAGGLERVDWILEQPVDIFILELGANDALRGLNLDKTYENLSGIFEKVKKAHPAAKLVLAGMLAPPNMGNDYTEKFAAIYPRLANEYNAALIPFLLDKVGGIPELNLADGIHPNEEGHAIVEKNVWAVLEGVVEQ
ncbi:MAG: arylesterase [Saprospiraceae bacterium]